MSTGAHRPTFNPAKGGESQGGYRSWVPSQSVSRLGLPAHLKMKTRKMGQYSKEELRDKDFKAELLAREQAHKPGFPIAQPLLQLKGRTKEQLRDANKLQSQENKLQLQENKLNSQENKLQLQENKLQLQENKLPSQEVVGSEIQADAPQYVKNEDELQHEVGKDQLQHDDADDVLKSSDDERDDNNDEPKAATYHADNNNSEEDEDDDGDDEDDDEAELLRELEKIKKEREMEQLRRAQAEREVLDQKRTIESLAGNPLLRQIEASPGLEGESTVKRKWNDDVVFKNQARDAVHKAPKKFVNDTIRSDFHRKFLDKYIK